MTSSKKVEEKRREGRWSNIKVLYLIHFLGATALFFLRRWKKRYTNKSEREKEVFFPRNEKGSQRTIYFVNDDPLNSKAPQYDLMSENLAAAP